MSRFAQADYARLRAYFERYRFSDGLLTENEAVAKNVHKNTLCAIQVWASARRAVDKNMMVMGDRPLQPESMQRMLLDEFFSDIVTSAFSAYHGLYKPAHVTLRSAVEVFVRAGAGNVNSEALETTSVFRLFEIAADCNVYEGARKKYFDDLKACYGELCGYAHTATPGHMGRIYAFADFPIYNAEKLSSFAKYHKKIVGSALSILIDNNAIIYNSVPPRARDLLDDALPAGPRLSALGSIDS